MENYNADRVPRGSSKAPEKPEQYARMIELVALENKITGIVWGIDGPATTGGGTQWEVM